jgi:hypothetical protein
MAWLTANRKGLANSISELERKRLVFEPIQNAMDTNAKNISVSITPPKYGYSTILVIDDDPQGFTDLSLAYDMFADTNKRDDHTKAGRFTIGEKRVLALCKEASIKSTTGEVVFEIKNGKEIRNSYPRRKLPFGTQATFMMEMNDQQHEDAVNGISQLIPKKGVWFTFNGQPVAIRKPFRVFPAKLQTVLANPKTRKMEMKLMETEVHLYEPLPNEAPCLYELGIPVVEIDCRWHVDVRQRVPLNMERDNIPPKFKSVLLALVANHGYDALTETDASKDWVRIAMGDKNIEEKAFESLKNKAYGEKTLIANPLDPESIARGTAEGYNVIFPRSLTEGQRENNKRFGTVPVSSSVFPTPKPYSDDPNAPPVEVVDEANWTEGMKLIHRFTKALFLKLVKDSLILRFVNTSNGFSACFGKGYGTPTMDYNIRRLGKDFFNNGVTEEVLSLIIHEFAHLYESNHLSEKYYAACTDLGARISLLALAEPIFFFPYIKKEK